MAIPLLYFPGDTTILFAYLFFICFWIGVFGEYKKNSKVILNVYR